MGDHHEGTAEAGRDGTTPEQTAEAGRRHGTTPDRIAEIGRDETTPEHIAEAGRRGTMPDQTAEVGRDEVTPEQTGEVGPRDEITPEQIGEVGRRDGITSEQVGAVGRRHGVGAEQIVEVAGGVANRGFVLGEGLFLRVSRPGFEGDLRKEAAVVPVARAAGVLTPAIVEYDESRTIVDAPYVVMQRVHGVEPTDGPPTGLAEQLARLHEHENGHEQTEIPGLPLDDRDDPWQTVDRLAERGTIDLGTAKWLGDWFTRLSGRFDRSETKVLIHGDVASHNLLAGPDGELRALIDWGDAAKAPRGMDFAKLPLQHVAAILPDYVRHTQYAVREEEVAAAALWFHLDWGLGKLTADPWPGQRHWTAPPGSRVLGLLRFFAAGPPAPWRDLT